MKIWPSAHVAAKDILTEMNNICSPHVSKEAKVKVKCVFMSKKNRNSYDSLYESLLYLDPRTSGDSFHESPLYLDYDSVVAIISHRHLYIRALSLEDNSPVWPHFYTVPLPQIHLCSLLYICSQGLKDSLVLFVYWISLPSTERECKLENTVTPPSWRK